MTRRACVCNKFINPSVTSSDWPSFPGRIRSNSRRTGSDVSNSWDCKTTSKSSAQSLRVVRALARTSVPRNTFTRYRGRYLRQLHSQQLRRVAALCAAVHGIAQLRYACAASLSPDHFLCGVGVLSTWCQIADNIAMNSVIVSYESIRQWCARFETFLP